MALNKPQASITIDPERSMSIAEIIRLLNQGEIRIVKIKYSKNRGYYVSMGKEFPVTFDILEAKPGVVVYRLGGSKKAWTPGSGVYYKVPAIAEPREGYAIAEIKGDKVILYLK